MLKQMRKNTKIIIWSVVVAFAMWGGYAVGNQFQKQGRIAGEIFGKSISIQEFTSFYRAAEIFNTQKEPERDYKVLKQRAWDSLIYSREARNLKVEVTDDEVREEIFRLLATVKIENPDPRLYRRWVEDNFREPVRDFEKQIRELLRIQKLVRRVNDAPIEAPKGDDVHHQFVFNETQLALEGISFPKLEDAKSFHGNFKDPKKWAEELKKDPKKFRVLPKSSLGMIVSQLSLSDDSGLGLLKIEKNLVSEPIPAGKEFLVVRITEKQIADETKYDKEFKPKYTGFLTEQKKYERFSKWHADLMKRAALVDYQPER